MSLENYNKKEYEKIGKWFVSQVKKQKNYKVAIDVILNDKESAYTFIAKLFTGIKSSS